MNMENPWSVRIPITKNVYIVNSHLAPGNRNLMQFAIRSHQTDAQGSPLFLVLPGPPGAPCMSLTLSGALRTFQVTTCMEYVRIVDVALQSV